MAEPALAAPTAKGEPIVHPVQTCRGRAQQAADADGPGGQAGTQLSASASVLRGTAALLSTKPLTWAVSLLTAVLLPRYLGDQGFGEYALALNIAGLAGTVASLGVPWYL